MLCPPRWACLRSCLPACLPSGLGCCARLAGLVFLLSAVLSPVLSAILAGMPCPPRWAVSGLVSQLVSHLVWDALSASLVLSFSCLWSCLAAFVFVLSRSLSFIWDAVSAPPGLVFFLSLVLSPKLVSHLVWDAASASLALSFSCLRSCLRPCLPSWLGCRVRLAGLSPVLSPSLSPIWSGMLCPPRWSCLSLVCGLVSGPVCHLGWDTVSASLGCIRSSPIWSGMLCPPPWSCLSLVSGLVSQLLSLFCLVACLSSGMLCLPPLGLSFSCLPACLPSGLGCCVRLAGLVFLLSAVLSPALSAILAGMPCPPRWAASGLVSQLVSHLVWDAVSASLVLSFSCLRSCQPSWLGCCVRLAGLSPVLSPSLSPIWSGMLCPPPWSCLSLVFGLVSQLLSLFCLVACLSFGMLCLPPLCLSFSCLWSCFPACLGCCVCLLGSSPSPACLRSFVPSCFPSWSGVSVLWATVWCLRWCNSRFFSTSVKRTLAY